MKLICKNCNKIFEKFIDKEEDLKSLECPDCKSHFVKIFEEIKSILIPQFSIPNYPINPQPQVPKPNIPFPQIPQQPRPFINQTVDTQDLQNHINNLSQQLGLPFQIKLDIQEQ